LKLFEPSVARAARAYTGLTHSELAKAANVASRTIYRLEKDGHVTPDSLQKILHALESRGVTIMSDDLGRVRGVTFTEVDDNNR
jgi:transcriptional regulator with XRE-family HTH domain